MLWSVDFVKTNIVLVKVTEPMKEMSNPKVLRSVLSQAPKRFTRYWRRASPTVMWL